MQDANVQTCVPQPRRNCISNSSRSILLLRVAIVAANCRRRAGTSAASCASQISSVNSISSPRRCSRLAQNEKPIHSRMHLFNGAEVTECFYTGKTDPDRDLVLDFRLKAVPEFFQIYLSDTRRVG